MKTKALIIKFSSLLCLALILSAYGCGLVGRGILKGAVKQLDKPETKQKIVHIADSLINALNESIKPKALGLENTIINKHVINWTDSLVEAISGKKLQANSKALQSILVGKTKNDIIDIRNSLQSLVDDIISDKTNRKLGEIRDNLLGAKTSDDIGRLRDNLLGPKTDEDIAKLRDELLGPKTETEIGNLRDQLLGAKTDTAISHIVDNAAKKVIDRVNDGVKKDASYISRDAIWLLVVGGIIAAGVIGFAWWNKIRYERMVTMLTKHINNIPDENIYKGVTAKIHEDAITAGLEPKLRKILSANGLTGNESWKQQVKYAYEGSKKNEHRD